VLCDESEYHWLLSILGNDESQEVKGWFYKTVEHYTLSGVDIVIQGYLKFSIFTLICFKIILLYN